MHLSCCYKYNLQTISLEPSRIFFSLDTPLSLSDWSLTVPETNTYGLSNTFRFAKSNKLYHYLSSNLINKLVAPGMWTLSSTFELFLYLWSDSRVSFASLTSPIHWTAERARGCTSCFVQQRMKLCTTFEKDEKYINKLCKKMKKVILSLL